MTRSARLLPALLLALPLLALATLPAAAHGDDAEEPYDPLSIDLPLFPAAGEKMVDAAPAEESAVAFRAGGAGGAHPPLLFSYPIRGPYVAEEDARFTLRLRVERPMVLQDKDGNSFEVSLLAGDKPLTGSPALVKAGQATPGLPGSATALTAQGTLAVKGVLLPEQGEITLAVRPLMPVVPPEGLKLLVGGGAEATSLVFPHLRLPSLDRLGLQDDRLLSELPAASASTFRSGEAVAFHQLRVAHDKVEAVLAEPPANGVVQLILVGAESSADAHRHHEFPDPDRRVAAAHAFQVGDRLVRVHPGVMVRVLLDPGPDGLTTRVKCVLNCPEGGFERVLPVRPPDSPQGATGSTLIPPPRSTKGIPTSPDAPPEEARNLLPAPSAALLVAAALAGAALPARRPRRDGKP